MRSTNTAPWPSTRARPIRGSEGYTLVEVVIATMLIAIMASSVFSVALTAKQSGGKAQRKLIAAQVSKQVTGALKNYVTADFSDPTRGPNANNAVNRWSLESVNPPVDCIDHAGTNEYALTPGSHTITGILPGWLEAAPYLGTLKYHVCAAGCANSMQASDGSFIPGVTVTIDWTEP